MGISPCAKDIYIAHAIFRSTKIENGMDVGWMGDEIRSVSRIVVIPDPSKFWDSFRRKYTWTDTHYQSQTGVVKSKRIQTTRMERGSEANE